MASLKSNEGSYEEDSIQKRPVDEHLQLMLTFAQEHELTLKTIIESTRNAMCEVSVSHYKPVRVGIETFERVYPQDLINWSNDSTSKQKDMDSQERESYVHLNKILLTFVYLQDEIYELKNIAESKFVYPLMMFGQTPQIYIPDTYNEATDDFMRIITDNSKRHHQNISEREVMIGRMIPFLQELSNYIDRCYNVTMNVIQQLNAFMCVFSHASSDSNNFSVDIYKRIFANTHMSKVFHTLGELLTVLITLDLITQQNDLLIEYWNQYKSLVTIIRNNPSNFNTSDENVLKFEKLIVSIDQTCMLGEIFKQCIEQNFDVYSNVDGNIVIYGSEPPKTKLSSVKYIQSVRNNNILLPELLAYLKGNLDTCLNVIGTTGNPSAASDVKERRGVIISMALYVLYRQLLPSNQPPDAKLHKVLWNVQKIVPFVILYDKVIWTIPEFLSSFLTFDTKKFEISNPLAYRRQYIATFDSLLSQKTSQLVTQCNAWYVICESKIQVSLRYEISNILSSLDIYGSILLKGYILASKLSYLLNVTLTMHSMMQLPLTKTNVNDIALLIEHLKAIEYTFIRKDFIYSEILPHVIRQLADDILKLLKPMKTKLEVTKGSSKSIFGGGVDVYYKSAHILHIIDIMENILKSTDNYTSLRSIILEYTHEILHYSQTLGTEKEMLKLKLFVQRIISLSNLQNDIRTITSTKFLYFHTDLLMTIIQSIYTSTTEGNRLQYVLTGFIDGIKLIQTCRHLEMNSDTNTSKMANKFELNKFFISYRLQIQNILYQELIFPLCHDIETDLRLHVHMKHLPHMQTYNPKFTNDSSANKNNSNNVAMNSPIGGVVITSSTQTAGTTVTGSVGTTTLRSYTTFLSIPSIHILGNIVNIHEEITHHLNKTFYNLTTITLHDWRMYAEMKSLAYEKYQLKLLNNFLPMGSLDQGLDVLQIMRNIHIFVNRFNYNMNIQQFIEYRSVGGTLASNPNAVSKHINTIKIQSIAASIRQHGLGVLNTTVNYTYQFLIQKFHIFREFLHDDYIRAHLSREHRWYRKHRHDPEINNMYPYEKAAKFVKDIRKLGINDGGKSYLDLFRMIITEIGNALGYVRMVRSASMYYCSEAVKYLPELDNIISFEQHAGSGKSTKKKPNESNNPDDSEDYVNGANFHEETVRAGKNLDEVIENLIKNFDAGSDYFKVLVNVFQTVLLSEENEDLKNFFVIVPSLCISWTEASLQAKDNMFKATRGSNKDMYFTDDGFAIGIAYCLAITKQTRKFEAMHWVDSVRAKIRVDAKVLEDQQAARAAKEAKLKDAKEKSKKSFSFFGKKPEKVEGKTVEEDYEDLEEVHTLQTTAKRLEALRRETEQLFYSLSSAAIFFKRTDVDT